MFLGYAKKIPCMFSASYKTRNAEMKRNEMKPRNITSISIYCAPTRVLNMSLSKLAKPRAKRRRKLVFEDVYLSVSNICRKRKGLRHVTFVHRHPERYSDHLHESSSENRTGWNTDRQGVRKFVHVVHSQWPDLQKPGIMARFCNSRFCISKCHVP